MNRNILIIVGLIILVVGVVLIKNQSNPKKQTEKKVVNNLSQIDKKLAKDLGLKEEKPKVPQYSKAKFDFDKCGKDGYYVEEKSIDLAKNYCLFIKKYGWRLVHPDYRECEEIRSLAGGLNYEKGREKIAFSFIRYGQNAACFWIFKR